MLSRGGDVTSLALDRWLAVLIGAVLATGLLTLRAGSAADAWVFVAHGIVAGSLLGVVAVKLRRSVPRAVAARRWRALGVAAVTACVVLAALAGGFAWVAAGRLVSIGSLTLLTGHAWLGLLLVPVIVAHLLPRHWRVLGPRRRRLGTASSFVPSRRTFLVTAAVGAVGIVAWSVPEVLDRLSGEPRRFTGSRVLPSGSSLPATTFAGDGLPNVDLAAWRLALTGLVDRPLEIDASELAAAGSIEVSAVLDCTSGWAYEGRWRGLAVGPLLDRAALSSDARTVVIRSVTGWTSELTIAEARACLLAVEMDGAPLSPEHGAPVRLVAPMRRGLDWVKWVAAIEIA